METLEEHPTCTFLPIAGILKSNKAIFYTDGIAFCRAIDTALNNKAQVELSFKGLTGVSQVFINSVLGFIYWKHDQLIIDELLRLSEVTKTIQEKIDDVKWQAKNTTAYAIMIEAACLGLDDIEDLDKALPRKSYDHKPVKFFRSITPYFSTRYEYLGEAAPPASKPSSSSV
jgi:hypothetical protein